MYMSHITYTLKLFCDAKTTFLLLVPCHFHKQKLNVRKNTMPLSYMYSNLSLQGGVLKKNKILIHLWIGKLHIWWMTQIRKISWQWYVAKFTLCFIKIWVELDKFSMLKVASYQHLNEHEPNVMDIMNSLMATLIHYVSLPFLN